MSDTLAVSPTAYNCTRCQAGLYAGDYSCRQCGLSFQTAVPAMSSQPARPWLAPQHTAALQVRMASGQTYTIQEILLFDHISLSQAANIKAQAMEKFGGFSTGLGSIGSLSHVVTTSLVVGTLEGVVSNSMRQTGMKLLEQAEQLSLQSRSHCYFFRLPQIFSVELPLPEMWQATLAVSPAENRLFIHNGDPMVIVRLSDGKVISLLWDKLESFEQPAFS